MKRRILVAEDEAPIREGIVTAFSEQNYEVIAASTGREAIQRLEDESFDLVISDCRMPEQDGLEVLRKARRLNEDAVVIMITAYGTVDHAVQVMREGAYDYVQKPFNLEDLEFRVAKALEHVRLRSHVRYLEDRLNGEFKCENIVGSSRVMREIFASIQKIAPSNASVLIQGETGTGKELVAEAIHRNSRRSKGAFVKMNCAALPETLLESELFGHEKGAFTGAEKLRVGRFELAHGGTLFLDEISDMSAGIQAKVLRALQEQEFERIGGTRTIKVDVRLIAASNQDLAKAIRAGAFREDLYYRVNVVTLTLPALRERKEDIEPLARHFVAKYAAEMSKSVKGISQEALRVLRRYNWPGNIRELENSMERAVLMTESNRIEHDDVALVGQTVTTTGQAPLPVCLPPQGMDLEEIEKEVLLEALKMSNYVQKEAAALLNISSRAMNYKVKKFGLTHPSWKKNRDPAPKPPEEPDTAGS
ncbi:MAG: sigma-54-dependent transcriptional regulator [Acidobacteriota bacterium]